MSRLDMPRGPTRGYHVNVWGYLVELLVDYSFVIFNAEGGLRDDDAQCFGKRSVWPAITIREAFRHLQQLGVIAVGGAEGAIPTAEVDLDGLTRLLRRDVETERLGRGDSKDVAALHYFRSRRLYVQLRWLDQILGVAHGE